MVLAKKKASNDLANNRKARHDYFIEDSMEVGLVLVGTEVKSIRQGAVSLKDAYASLQGGEVFVENMHVAPYTEGNRFNVDPLRKRKLLLHKKEIQKLKKALDQKGYTLVPLKLYLVRGRVKMELGLARGKKLYDKRESLKEKAVKKKLREVMKY